MTPSAARRILLADADAFFVAVARMSDPEGIGREPLLIVGGTRERRGGMACARPCPSHKRYGCVPTLCACLCLAGRAAR